MHIRCRISSSKSTRKRLAAGLRPDPLGELERSPRPPSRKRGRGERMGGEGKAGEGKGKGREGKGREGGGGGEGKGRAPTYFAVIRPLPR